MCPIVFKCIKYYPIVSNVSIPIQMYPIFSKYIQNLNLTFKAINKDNTIYYNIENLAMPIIRERIIKTTSKK